MGFEFVQKCAFVNAPLLDNQNDRNDSFTILTVNTVFLFVFVDLSCKLVVHKWLAHISTSKSENVLFCSPSSVFIVKELKDVSHLLSLTESLSHETGSWFLYPWSGLRSSSHSPSGSSCDWPILLRRHSFRWCFSPVYLLASVGKIKRHPYACSLTLFLWNDWWFAVRF